MTPTRQHALEIWQAAVDSANPVRCVRDYLERGDFRGRIVVLGGGKAGADMALGVEQALADQLERVTGLINIPAGTQVPLEKIIAWEARPAGSNQPTARGVAGVDKQLALVDSLEPGDLALCLLSGGGSALLPAPAPGITLAAKQEVTLALHACGATIDEMNCVRKHLSRYKGGRLAQRILQRGAHIVSLILSDVIGDPLDVIASGPTAPDPATFADALAVLERYQLVEKHPVVVDHLRRGQQGEIEDTPKVLPAGIENHILANNAQALLAAARRAEHLGYRVVNLGSFLDGETLALARVLAGVIRSLRTDGQPAAPPVCLLSGGETTVTLSPGHGKGGRNQEFSLALLSRLGEVGLQRTIVLSAGTDGEDGPTDAAGAFADLEVLQQARNLQLDPGDYLGRHDAYPFFAATGGLLVTGLTRTNVMDVRIALVG